MTPFPSLRRLGLAIKGSPMSSELGTGLSMICLPRDSVYGDMGAGRAAPVRAPVDAEPLAADAPTTASRPNGDGQTTRGPHGGKTGEAPPISL